MCMSLVLPTIVPMLVPAFSSRPRPAAELALVTAGVALQPAARAEPAARDWNGLATKAWLTCSIVLAALLLLSQQRLARRLRECQRARVDGKDLLVSDSLGPAVVGFLDTVIVLPAWVFALGEQERRLVVSHEREHQRVRDPAVSIAALSAAVLFPWNVALWWQLSRLRLAIELDCDARVVAQSGADPVAYGKLLVTAHENSQYARGLALALAPLHSALGQRVMALLSRGAEAGRSQSRQRVARTGGLTFAALGVLALAPVPALPPALAAAMSPPAQQQPMRTDYISSANVGHTSADRLDSTRDAAVTARTGNVYTFVPARTGVDRSARQAQHTAKTRIAQQGAAGVVTLGTDSPNITMRYEANVARDGRSVMLNSSSVSTGDTASATHVAPSNVIRTVGAPAGTLTRATPVGAGTATVRLVEGGQGGTAGAGGAFPAGGRGGFIRAQPVGAGLSPNKSIDRNGFMGAEVRVRPDIVPPSSR